MLKLMENDYVFHWDMLQKPPSSLLHQRVYHEGACDIIVRYYEMLLDCTTDEAYERMQKRVEGA
jgi:hypothetical protein